MNETQRMEEGRMKEKTKKTKKGIIATLVFFSLTVFSAQAKVAESTKDQQLFQGVNRDEIVTIKVTPVAPISESRVSLDSFTLAKNQTQLDNMSFGSKKRGDSNLTQSKTNFASTKPNTQIQPAAYDPHRHLKRQFKTSSIEQTIFTSTLISLAALNVADFLTTRKALQYDGLTEGNPLMKPLVKNDYVFAAAKIGVTCLSTYFMHKLFKKNKKMAWLLSAVSNIAFSYVVASNIRLINKAENGGLCPFYN